MIEVTLDITDMPEQEWQYPCLVVSTTTGVIVYAIGEGTVSHYKAFEGVSLSGEARRVGCHSTTWVKNSFKLYTHPITLKNI